MNTHLFLHVADAVNNSFGKISIRTVDKDAIILAIANFDKIKPDELWLAFGPGASFRCFPVHQLVESIESGFCSMLPVFHILTS